MFFLGEALLKGDELRKDPQEGIEWLKRAADFGDLSALVPLGIAYSDGTVREDLTLANMYFEEAAERGDAEAMYRYANNLRNGKGISKNEKEAFRWYEKASAEGHLDAMNQLAICYNSGFGTTKNQKKAFDLFEKAASLGQMQATANLAVCYAKGLGVPVNQDESTRLYLQVINSNDQAAKEILRLLEKDK
jgi:TPR repeat protein